MSKNINKINRLIEVYGDTCWMGYTVSDRNPYTFHHIKKDCDGGKRNLENGALLSIYAHKDLNEIERKLKQYYLELNKLFRELNATKAPPTLEYYIELNKILKKVSSIIMLSKYYNPKREITIVENEEYENSNGIFVLQKRFRMLT